MKKLLAIALLLVSVVATDALARYNRNGGNCRTKCCPTKCPPKKRCAQREDVIGTFGYVKPSCTRMVEVPAYQYTQCTAYCRTNDCNPCFDTAQEAEQALEQDGYQVINQKDADAVAQRLVDQHMQGVR